MPHMYGEPPGQRGKHIKKTKTDHLPKQSERPTQILRAKLGAMDLSQMQSLFRLLETRLNTIDLQIPELGKKIDKAFKDHGHSSATYKGLLKTQGVLVVERNRLVRDLGIVGRAINVRQPKPTIKAKLNTTTKSVKAEPKTPKKKATTKIKKITPKEKQGKPARDPELVHTGRGKWVPRKELIQTLQKELETLSNRISQLNSQLNKLRPEVEYVQKNFDSFKPEDRNYILTNHNAMIRERADIEALQHEVKSKIRNLTKQGR